MVDIVALVMICLFPIGYILGFCEPPRLDYTKAAELLKKELDN